MTEAMPFLQKYDITFLRPLPIRCGLFTYKNRPPPREAVTRGRALE